MYLNTPAPPPPSPQIKCIRIKPLAAMVNKFYNLKFDQNYIKFYCRCWLKNVVSFSYSVNKQAPIVHAEARQHSHSNSPAQNTELFIKHPAFPWKISHHVDSSSMFAGPERDTSGPRYPNYFLKSILIFSSHVHCNLQLSPPNVCQQIDSFCPYHKLT